MGCFALVLSMALNIGGPFMAGWLWAVGYRWQGIALCVLVIGASAWVRNAMKEHERA